MLYILTNDTEAVTNVPEGTYLDKIFKILEACGVLQDDDGEQLYGTHEQWKAAVEAIDKFVKGEKEEVITIPVRDIKDMIGKFNEDIDSRKDYDEPYIILRSKVNLLHLLLNKYEKHENI